jgi:pimeloyl-ACP methyl ester carboxylesterase
MKTITATLHDGAKIDVEISGSGPAVLVPVSPIVITGEPAKEKEKWGMDPLLGRHLIDGLNDKFTVIAFDYEGFRMQHPAAETLTPDNIVKDFLAVADEAGVDKFAYYGFSWLGLSGLQLAIRTDRLWALIMGGFPPLDGPYKEMLIVTETTHAMSTGEAQKKPTQSLADNREIDWDSIDMALDEGQTKQFVTLYKSLQSFDDKAVQAKLTCPRLCFAGSKDTIVYGERWGDVTVDIAGPLLKKSQKLKSLGWDVRVLDGLDHMTAMQPKNVLSVIKQWLLDNA